LKDPRVKNVTVTFVEVSADLRLAKVHVSVMGDETQEDLSLRGLRNAAGYLQQKVSNRVDLRYTPKLQFVLDKGIKNAFEVTRILEEVLPKEDSQEDSDDEEQNETDESSISTIETDSEE
jgi:ribosome-binding factor A